MSHVYPGRNTGRRLDPKEEMQRLHQSRHAVRIIAAVRSFGASVLPAGSIRRGGSIYEVTTYAIGNCRAGGTSAHHLTMTREGVSKRLLQGLGMRGGSAKSVIRIFGLVSTAPVLAPYPGRHRFCTAL